MACIQVIGLDHAVSVACGAGQLELNTHMPLVGLNLVRSFKLLSRSCALFADRCVSGIQANRDTCERHFEISGGLATILNPKLGYDHVAELVKDSLREGKSLRELVLERQILNEKELNEILAGSTGPSSSVR